MLVGIGGNAAMSNLLIFIGLIGLTVGANVLCAYVRTHFQPTAKADRDENQNKAPGEKQLPEGQIERQLRNE